MSTTKPTIPANANITVSNTTKHDIELPYVEGMPKEHKKRLLASKLDEGVAGRKTRIVVKGGVLARLLDNRVFKAMLDRGEIHAGRGLF